MLTVSFVLILLNNPGLAKSTHFKVFSALGSLLVVIMSAVQSSTKCTLFEDVTAHRAQNEVITLRTTHVVKVINE